MPITELHKRKLTKNLTVAGILVGLMGLLFVLTLVKFGGG